MDYAGKENSKMRKKNTEAEETSKAVNATLIGSIAKSFSELSPTDKGIVLGFTQGLILAGQRDERARA